MKAKLIRKTGVNFIEIILANNEEINLWEGIVELTNGNTDNKVTIAELKQIISTLKLSIDKEVEK